MIRLRYFAHLREQLGIGSEELEAAANVDELIGRLRARGGKWAEAVGSEGQVLAAVNQEMATPRTPIRDGDEVAFFPPVTGG